jgi:GNAT superfamily N-acetyltransferase
VTTIPDSAVAPSADRIEIAERPPSNPDAARLLRALHGEQLQRYGFADPAELPPGEYTTPSGVFAVAYYGGVPVGCGGYRWFDKTTYTVEIKRIYIVPASRGRGAGRAMLSWLERHAIAAGARRAILESGVRNTAALDLITSTGYLPVDRYVEGRDPAINRAFARSLISEI